MSEQTTANDVQWVKAPQPAKWVMLVRSDIPQMETAYLCTPRAEVVKWQTRLEVVGYAETAISKAAVCVVNNGELCIIPRERVKYMRPVEVAS